MDASAPGRRFAGWGWAGGLKVQEADLEGQTGQGGEVVKAEDGVETGAVIRDGFNGEAKVSDYTSTTKTLSDAPPRARASH